MHYDPRGAGFRYQKDPSELFLRLLMATYSAQDRLREKLIWLELLGHDDLYIH
jgi:hypothetical protein